MKSVLHRANERGEAEHGWLHTRFSFSFADWYDPERMGFGALRVLNDDVIEPHQGFGMHPHANMEIITIVKKGAVSHEDSMGNKYAVPAGDIQVMSAGSGVTHAEFNKGDEQLALFQIWITPRVIWLPPHYSQQSLGSIQKNEIELLVSGDPNDDALFINQDAYVFRALCDGGKTLTYALRQPGNGVYIFVVKGSIRVDGTDLGARDALGVWDTDKVEIITQSPAELLVFEVPRE
ncbi:MAG: hypothetical protein A2481_00150 [Candidatus Yonathbacteria bacterium RIFOXYC2_FULL_47_9]|nr:MAG: hypothetical protein A2481_00150 [Candidatus Yonathbacteria bacterium RIFOXYC2_FULL_47_9]HAT68703.1 hypothetical protein [Candidatus Yonathbacteria bacterium]